MSVSLNGINYIRLLHSVPTVNSSANTDIADVIGNKNDSDNGGANIPGVGSLYSLSYIFEKHMHSPSYVYPRNVSPITLTAGVGAWTEGTKVEIIPASTIGDPYDVHYVLLGNISANDDYVIKVYYGGAGSEVYYGECAVTRDTNQVRGSQVPLQGIILSANTRLSMSLLSGLGSNTVDVKAYIHEY